MDKETQLWNEYQMLRDEIRSADTLNYQIMGIIVGAVAAIFTAGLSQVEPQADSWTSILIFLCAYMVTIPGYRLLQGNRRRIWQVSTYIRVFLEPQFEFINWETRLDSQRKRAKAESVRQKLSSLIGTNEWFILSMMNFIIALAAIVNGLLQVNTTLSIQVSGIVAIVILNVWLLLATSRQERELRRLGKVEQDYLKYWRDIQNDEKASS